MKKRGTEAPRPDVVGQAGSRGLEKKMRVSDAFLKSIDGWRRHQPDLLSRSEAIPRPCRAGAEGEGEMTWGDPWAYRSKPRVRLIAKPIGTPTSTPTIP
jgi:hypothetical protein